MSTETSAETASEESESDSNVEAQGETTSTRSRWWLTNDVLAFLLVIGFYFTIWLVGNGVLSPVVLKQPSGIAMMTYTGIAVAWAFGSAAIRAWRNG